MIKFVQIYNPIVRYKELTYEMDYFHLCSFGDFDDVIEKQISKGYNVCLYYSITNVVPTSLYGCGIPNQYKPIKPLCIRAKFIMDLDEPSVTEVKINEKVEVIL